MEQTAALWKQIEDWHEADEHQKIVEAIASLPEEARTAELISVQARAYNNLADGSNSSYFRQAIELLERVEDQLQNDHNWNFRMAYAYYYLDQEGTALSYFEKALELRPGDADTIEFIKSCQEYLSLPRFERSFRQRAAEGWASFLDGEAELRRMIADRVQGDAIIEQCNALLASAFTDVSFELGYNGEKYELILTPEGDRAKMFALVYFQQQVPKAVLQHWNILVGRQPSEHFSLRMFDQNLSAADVLVWVETQEDETVYLSFYSEKLVPLLQEQENQAYWFMMILLDQTIGEIASMQFVADITLLEMPLAKPGIYMDTLLDYLQQEFQFTAAEINNALSLCNKYTMYEMEPNEEEDADLRLDVFAGVSTCPSLINAYLQNDSRLMDNYHRDGIVPGFFYYPLNIFADEQDRSVKILDFRDALETAILEQAGADAITFTGGASGVYFGYLDFIAWDLQTVLDAAVAVLANTALEWAAFHSLRRNVGGILLKDTSAELVH